MFRPVIPVVVLIVAASAPHALENLQMDLGRVESEVWQGSGITFSVRPSEDDRLSVDLRAAQVELPPPFDAIQSLFVQCTDAVLTTRGASCTTGRMQLKTALAEIPDVSGNVAFEYADNAVTVEVSGAQFASGNIGISVERGARRWRADVQGDRMSARKVSELISHFAGPFPTEIESGEIWIQATVRGGTQVSSVDAKVQIRGVSFSDAQGFRAGENVDLKTRFSARKNGSGWKFEISAAWQRGEAYFKPVYLKASGSPLDVKTTGTWNEDSRILRLSELVLRHPEVGALRGDLSLTVGNDMHLHRLHLAAPRAGLKGAYEVLLQPFLVGKVLGDLQTDGHAELSLDLSGGGEGAARIVLDDVSLVDRKGRFGVGALSGEATWVSSGDAAGTRLNWEFGHLYRVDLGAGRLAGEVQGQGFRLTRPLLLPVLDGVLRIEDLKVSGVGSSNLSWEFQGRLNPVSMERVSIALGWPSMGGMLSGVIPAVRYAEGEMTLDGSLSIRAFDGLITIRNVRLIRPFGLIPVLFADVDVEHIALDALTRAFSFGNIQGRLEGQIHDLVLEDWRPRSFDAKFSTPAGDGSPHRISQRAVDNLARLGGAGGVVSQTFLRFMKEFSYDRIGLSCRLRRGVCEMDGVAPASKGYYIVKGGGFPPRIDVLGFNRQVDWDTLVKRLKGVTRTEGPIIR